MTKIILIVIFFFLIPFKTSASQIAIVDIQFLLQNSKEGKSLQKNLNDINEKNLKNFKKIEDEFKKKEAKIVAKKNIISETDYKKEVDAFRKEVEKYNLEKRKKISEFNKNRNSKIAKLLEKINSSLVDYANKNNISTTIDKKYIIITKSENDITQKILKVLDK